MTTRHRIIRLAATATAGIGLAAALAVPAAATAKPHDSTLACQLTTPICNEPVVAVAQTSANDFTPADDAGLTVQPGHFRVFTRPNNALDNGRQDWTANIDGFVPVAGPGDYGFTAFDNLHYGGRPFISEEWTPFGQSTGLCLNLRVSDERGVLQPCDGRRGEEFILTTHVPTVLPPAVPGYSFSVSVRHAPTTARHLLLTGRDSGYGQVFGRAPIHHSPAVATQQMWAALP